MPNSTESKEQKPAPCNEFCHLLDSVQDCSQTTQEYCGALNGIWTEMKGCYKFLGSIFGSHSDHT